MYERKFVARMLYLQQKIALELGAINSILSFYLQVVYKIPNIVTK